MYWLRRSLALPLQDARSSSSPGVQRGVAAAGLTHGHQHVSCAIQSKIMSFCHMQAPLFSKVLQIV
eukprot:2207015-Pleurochrysis_carterae.AAC.1